MSHAGPVERDVAIFYLYMVLAILPVIVVYLFLSKFIIRGIGLGSVKG
jgi:multiple sugar transport system permease protein